MRLALLLLWPLSSPPPLGLVVTSLLLAPRPSSGPLPSAIRSSQELSIFRSLRRTRD